MLIIKILLVFLSFAVINFIAYSIAAYIDARYHITDFILDNDPPALVFGIGIILPVIVLFIYLSKLPKFTFKPYLYFIKLGEKHHKQDNDPTYQLEKAVFGKKQWL